MRTLFCAVEVPRGPGPRCSGSRVKPGCLAGADSPPTGMDERRVACADGHEDAVQPGKAMKCWRLYSEREGPARHREQ